MTEYLTSNVIENFKHGFFKRTGGVSINEFSSLNCKYSSFDTISKINSNRAIVSNLMGIKNVSTSNSIKIFGNPNLKINKKIIIKNYLKDHRVFMTSVIAALSFGGQWYIHDKNSISSSFPNFLKIINEIKKND